MIDIADIMVQLPDYPCVHIVSGIERRCNHGPMLTLAVAQWQREGMEGWHPVRDIVTQMRLADAVSDQHDLPINAEKLYGPTGRRGPVGRLQGDAK